MPRAERIEHYPDVPENNFIDRLVFRKLRKLNILPSELADDAEYLRRVYLDVIGTLPTPAEARRFLADKRPDRRARLVEELLQRPEFADFWALQWADLLRVDRAALGPKRAYAYYNWIRDSFAANRPFDEFARELVDGRGAAAARWRRPTSTRSSTSRDRPPARWRRFSSACASPAPNAIIIRSTAGARTIITACRRSSPALAITNQQRRGNAPADGLAQARNPRTGVDILAHPLGEKMPAKARAGRSAGGAGRLADPVRAIPGSPATWPTASGPTSSAAGLVEPVDDVRATNPPSNPELLDALADIVVREQVRLARPDPLITASRVYQLSRSRTPPTNATNRTTRGRCLKRLGAEVLLDMVCQTTGVAEHFTGCRRERGPSSCGTARCRTISSKCSAGRSGSVPASANAITSRASPRCCTCSTRREIHAKLSHEGGCVAKLVKRQSSGWTVGRGVVSDVLQPLAAGEGTAGRLWRTCRNTSEAPRGRRRSGVEHDEFAGVPLQSLRSGAVQHRIVGHAFSLTGLHVRLESLTYESGRLSGRNHKEGDRGASPSIL